MSRNFGSSISPCDQYYDRRQQIWQGAAANIAARFVKRIPCVKNPGVVECILAQSASWVTMEGGCCSRRLCFDLQPSASGFDCPGEGAWLGTFLRLTELRGGDLDRGHKLNS